MPGLESRTALVTGGSRGIGAAIARQLARAGADVAITYVSAPDRARAVVAEIETAGRRGRAIRADAGEPDAVAAAVDEAAAALGRLDILVNNAGIFAYGPPEAVTAEQLDRVLAVNVRAVFAASQAALRHLGDGGRIVSIGSCLGRRAGASGTTLYAMSKSALIGLTKGLARDLGGRGITVNLVDPGSTDTDMNPADGEAADAQRAQMALGRFGTPEDVAAMVVHLAGEGGRFVTGAAISVDGGYDA